MKPFAFALLAVAFLYGCADQELAANSAPNATPPPSSPPQSQVPPMMQEISPEDAAKAEAEGKTLTAKYDNAKAAYKKNTKDAKLTKAYAEATMALAEFYMYKSPEPERVKYPNALYLYDDVVAVDPANKKAADSASTIRDIYTNSLHRAIPPRPAFLQ